ncbi:MAG: hypothetical protein mread185_000252 [Mycoplasmataceae bacterium]|nr:MAG: hypothetical protein mread185_000252 [Mycoplasmataceae bacterium]
MSEELKNCSHCQKNLSQEKAGDKSYTLYLEKNNHTEFCSSCWELKKNDYKEQLKEKGLEELKKTFGSRKFDKNDEEVINTIRGWINEKGSDGHGWSNSSSTELTLCWACDKWNEGQNNHSSCQAIISEKRELKGLQEQWKLLKDFPENYPTRAETKKRLEELERKYPNSNNSDNDSSRERESKNSLKSTKSSNIFSLIMSNPLL